MRALLCIEYASVRFSCPNAQFEAVSQDIHYNNIMHDCALFSDSDRDRVDIHNTTKWRPSTRRTIRHYYIDFDLAAKLSNRDATLIGPPTPNYLPPLAPEVGKNPHDPFAADVWQLGVLLTQLFRSQVSSRVTGQIKSTAQAYLFDRIKKLNIRLLHTCKRN